MTLSIINESTQGLNTQIIEVGSSNDNFGKIHGWALWLTWFVLGLVQIFSNRYLKVFWKLYMWIHKITGTTILILTITFVVLIIKKEGGSLDTTDPHTTLGLFVMTLNISVTLFGLFTKSRMNSLEWRTQWVLRVKYFHKVTYQSIYLSY
jgi:ABC-type amino acid transport system permease subunit